MGVCSGEASTAGHHINNSNLICTKLEIESRLVSGEDTGLSVNNANDKKIELRRNFDEIDYTKETRNVVHCHV